MINRACERRVPGFSLRSLAAIALALLSPAALAQSPSSSDPWRFHDPAFARIAQPGAQPVFIAGEFNGCEGAVWIQDAAGGHLRFGAVHTDVAFRWDPKNGLRGLRAPSYEASAFVPHPRGGVIAAEQTTRRIVRYEQNGEVTTLAERFEGKRLNRPNDLALRADGSVWFTDPDYLFKVRPHETKELPGQFVFRLNPETGGLRAMVRDLILPNGIAFGPDESALYVGDSGTKLVYRWPLRVDDTLGPREEFVRVKNGPPDGIAFDREGNLWVACNRSVEIFSPAGKPLAELMLPGKRPASVAFGGPDGDWLFVCTRAAVYRLTLAVPLARRT